VDGLSQGSREFTTQANLGVVSHGRHPARVENNRSAYLSCSDYQAAARAETRIDETLRLHAPTRMCAESAVRLSVICRAVTAAQYCCK
jgi:hypothetical protein